MRAADGFGIPIPAGARENTLTTGFKPWIVQPVD